MASGLGSDRLGADELGPDPDRSEAAGRARLPAAVRKHLGLHLRAAYRERITPEPTTRLRELIEQLQTVLDSRPGVSDTAFRDGLTAALPALQAFAHSLAGNLGRAEDLVQETLLKAWANQERFTLGTNLNAWLFTILRNQFYSECRKHRREVEDVNGVMAGQLIEPAAQEHGSDLQVVFSHMARLPPLQREALLLVGAQGMTYEAAAEVMGCQTGTVKSRVSRARAYLFERLELPSASLSA